MSFSMILEGTTQTFFLMNSLSSRTVFQDTRQWINILDLILALNALGLVCVEICPFPGGEDAGTRLRTGNLDMTNVYCL